MISKERIETIIQESLDVSVRQMLTSHPIIAASIAQASSTTAEKIYEETVKDYHPLVTVPTPLSVDKYKTVFHAVREGLLEFKPLYNNTELATTAEEYNKAFDIAFAVADKINKLVSETVEELKGDIK